MTELRTRAKALADEGRVGDTTFDGLATRRVYDPFARSRCLDDIALHPPLLAAVREYVGACQLGMTVVSELLPGQAAQAPHRDGAVYPLPAGFGPVMVTAIWAIDEFTPSNGATVVAPGSHTSAVRAKQAECHPVTMAPGSVLLVEGRSVHAAGANRGDTPRLGVILEYVASWLRPPDNHTLAVPPETVATLPTDLQELLGYNQRTPYHGFIAGHHPRTWLAAKVPGASTR